MTFAAAALVILRNAIPAILAMAVMLTADALIGGWTTVVVGVLVVLALLAYFGRRDRAQLELGSGGGPIDAVPNAVSTAAGFVPIMLVIVVWTVGDYGIAFLCIGIVVLVVVAQTIVLWWYNRPAKPQPT